MKPLKLTKQPNNFSEIKEESREDYEFERACEILFEYEN